MMYWLLSLCLLWAPCQAKSGICLVLAVGDDAKVIQGCLESVQGVIDCSCICDMGSQDETGPIVGAFMQERQIPGVWFGCEWRGLHAIRSMSVDKAKGALQELGFSLEGSYLLLLDPTMRLHLPASFQKGSLHEKGYLILDASSTFDCSAWNLHLISAAMKTEEIVLAWEDALFENGERFPKLSEWRVEEPAVLHRALERRGALLSNALLLKSHHPRAHFELAHIQMSYGKYTEAIANFQKCIEQTKKAEPIWFCQLKIGQCYERLGDWDQALHYFLEMYQANPKRGEPLRSIASHYRSAGMNDLAYLFAKQGTRIPAYTEWGLAQCPPLSSYRFDEELSIAAFYTPFKKEGERALYQLLLRKQVPWDLKDQAYRNALFYVTPLQDASYQPIEFALPLIHPDGTERYHPMNPSIRKTGDGYEVICRAVNYTQTGAKFFNTVDPTGVYRTKNFLLHYDTQLQLKDQEEIVEELPRHRVRAFNLEGLDDCRLFAFENRSWFTCTTSDTNPTGNFQISLCRLGAEAQSEKLFVDQLTPLIGPDPNRCEKNWLPFILNGEIHVIYSYDPLVIYKLDPSSCRCEVVKESTPSLDMSRFRGSAAPVPWNEGYLVLVHEVAYNYSYERIYLHRFLFLDRSFNVMRLSDPFYFQHQGVEFCCGMEIDHTGKTVILTLGDEDRFAWFCKVPLATVEQMFHSVQTLLALQNNDSAKMEPLD